MNLIPKVNRSYYRKMRQSELGNFALLIAGNAESNPRYSSLVAETTVLKAKAEDYATALQQAKQGGRDRITTKDLAKKEVYMAFNDFSDGLDYFAKGDVSFITDLGLKSKETTVKYDGPLFMPYQISARSNGFPGIIIVTFSINPIQVSATQKVALEWSDDNGTTWHNGKYGSDKSNITVMGLPSGKTILIRLRCIGSRDRVSKWSEYVSVTVA